MFGYVVCNKKALSQEEQERYQSVYCGVCRSLKKRFGQLERFSLSYDMTFLALFLSALYEPWEEEKNIRCVLHPLKKKTAVENEFIDYAADMTVVLSYYKCMDDWEDERKHIRRQYGKYLEKKLKNIEQRYPRQCKAVEKYLKEFSRLEKSPDAKPDEVINSAGMMLSELFVYKEDFWSNSLRNFGYELGRFVYLMDAAMDYEKDEKTGNYNPLRMLQKQPEDMEQILTIIMGNATEEFEKLPIVQDEHLLRNILYSGVWQMYRGKMAGKEKANG